MDMPLADPPMAHAELSAIFEAAVDAIVVIDEQGLILALNRAAERMFGHPVEAVLGSSVEILMPEPDRSNHSSYLRRYLEGGAATIIGVGRETEAMRADGRTFPIALSVGEAVSNGRRRFVAIIRDLTTQRAAEKHARTVESRLAQMYRFNLMGEMAAGIAHEINQPLSAIATYAQAAKRILGRQPVNTTMLGEICEKIDEQARRAGQVMHNLRNFIRRTETKPAVLNVNDIIEEVRGLMEADARGEGIGIAFRYGRNLPLVSVDPVQLQQVLLNLTRNAVDELRAIADRQDGIIVASMTAGAGGIRVSVSDRGRGVSKELGEEIFHPFVTTKENGLGVGLAISRSIIQSFGGRLNFQDRPGGGAVFILDLPAASSSEPGPTHPA